MADRCQRSRKWNIVPSRFILYRILTHQVNPPPPPGRHSALCWTHVANRTLVSSSPCRGQMTRSNLFRVCAALRRARHREDRRSFSPARGLSKASFDWTSFCAGPAPHRALWPGIGARGWWVRSKDLGEPCRVGDGLSAGSRVHWEEEGPRRDQAAPAGALAFTRGRKPGCSGMRRTHRSEISPSARPPLHWNPPTQRIPVHRDPYLHSMLGETEAPSGQIALPRAAAFMPGH